MSELTTQQLTFIDAYFVCSTGEKFNATQAALDAGYSAKTAHSQASRLLKNVKVQAEIKRRMQTVEYEATEALREMGRMARSSMEDFLTFPGQWPYIDLEKARELGVMDLVKKVRVRADGGVELELYDKQRAIQLMGKAHGLWKDGVEITINIDLLDQLVKALRRAEMDEETVFLRMIAAAEARAEARARANQLTS